MRQQISILLRDCNLTLTANIVKQGLLKEHTRVNSLQYQDQELAQSRYDKLINLTLMGFILITKKLIQNGFNCDTLSPLHNQLITTIKNI